MCIRDTFEYAIKGAPRSLLIGDQPLVALLQVPGTEAERLAAFVALLERESLAQGLPFDPSRPIQSGPMPDGYWFNNDRGGQSADQVWRRIAGELRTTE